MKNAICDIFHIVWWLGWRTVAFLGTIVGFMMLVQILDEVIL